MIDAVSAAASQLCVAYCSKAGSKRILQFQHGLAGPAMHCAMFERRDGNLDQLYALPTRYILESGMLLFSTV